MCMTLNPEWITTELSQHANIVINDKRMWHQSLIVQFRLFYRIFNEYVKC